MIEFEEIKAFSDRIASRFNPERIILFGSYAYGEPGEDSDVDILVIMPFEGSPPKKAVEICRAVGRPTFPNDLLVRHPDEIQWRYSGGDPLIGDALDKGIILYDRSGNNHPRVA